jgi:hypothetical protein
MSGLACTKPQNIKKSNTAGLFFFLLHGYVPIKAA